MLRSMFAGVSGLRSHQTMMDVVGNNIANVNTAGFKASRTTFQDALTQVIRGAAGVGADRGGTNPMQVGLGSQVASIDSVLGQGSVQLTGRNTDLAIQGDGFFVVGIGGQTLYSRAGAFGLDASGALTAPSGGRVMGWMPNAAGAIDTQTPIVELTLPTGQVIEPVATENITMGGNLPATSTAGPPPTVVNTAITVYDSLGNAHEVAFAFTKTATANEWTLSVADPDGAGPITTALASPTLTFDASGALIAPATGSIVLTMTGMPGTPAAQTIDLNFNQSGIELVQFGDTATAEARRQDGVEMGFLRGFDFGTDGTITGRFSNGESKTLGVVAIATFNNASGLSRAGDNVFAVTPNSGEGFVGRPGNGDAGILSPGSLEMSNVDLAQEFTNLIIAQRGFQANSRSITASDEMLADIVNLKR